MAQRQPGDVIDETDDQIAGDEIVEHEPSPGGVLPPREVEYNPERDREKARRLLAYILVLLLAIVVIASFRSLWLMSDDGFANLKSLLEVIFAPIIALVGTATGFYFGGGRTSPQSGVST